MRLHFRTPAYLPIAPILVTILLTSSGSGLLAQSDGNGGGLACTREGP